MTFWCERASWESLLRRRKTERWFNLVVNMPAELWGRGPGSILLSFCVVSIDEVMVLKE